MTAVAITPRSFRQTPGEHHERLAAAGLEVRFPGADRPLSEAEMIDLVRGCDGLVVGVDPVTEAVLRAGPLHVVVKYGSGLDNVDLEAAQRLGVTVRATPGANARSVAELTVALLLALARNVALHDRSVRAGSWSRRAGFELAGRRLGLIGYGAVGREVAGIARALGMEVVAHDPLLAAADVELVGIDEVLGSSDAVSLHLPLTEETRGLIGRRELGLMRPGALLINTARGGLVDEAALAEVLRSERLGGAALDVFAHEPPSGSPLLDLDSFVASPHAGAATLEAARRASTAALDELLAAL
ncbi:MAG TPA: phosphoglycerate dehydrogenase [Gaiellaceae bacterium]|jgi:D-3-phosphoglycerate dehydrogenase